MKIKILGVFLAAILVAGAVFAYLTLRAEFLSAKAEIASLRSQFTEVSAKAEKVSAQQKPVTEDLLPKLRDLDLKQFQAVHLTDGTVYFGKITAYTTDFLVLKDVYYIQGGYDDPSKSQAGTFRQAQTSLVKRGSELHAPEDSMTINITNVAFVETLKIGGQVLEAIELYEGYGR